MKTIPALTIATALCAFAFHSAPAAEAPPDFRFQVERLVEGIPQPMALAVAPDGRIFSTNTGAS